MTCHYPDLGSAYADLQPVRSIYAFSNNPQKHSHHVDIRNKNNNAKNCARTHLKTISTTQIWVARAARQQYGPSALDRFSDAILWETTFGVRVAKCNLFSQAIAFVSCVELTLSSLWNPYCTRRHCDRLDFSRSLGPPPREERGLISRTAAGNRALHCDSITQNIITGRRLERWVGLSGMYSLHPGR